MKNLQLTVLNGNLRLFDTKAKKWLASVETSKITEGVVVEPEQVVPVPFIEQIPFDKPLTVYEQKFMTENVTLSANTVGSIPNTVTVVRLVANGTATLSFSGIKEISGSKFVDTNGKLNYINLWYDGTDYFANVFQEKNSTPVVAPTPTPTPVAPTPTPTPTPTPVAPTPTPTPTPVAPSAQIVAWENLTNATDSGGFLNYTAATAGGRGTVPIDTTNPFEVYAQFNSLSLATVLFLDRDAASTYAWASQTFEAGAYTVSGSLYWAVNGTVPNTLGAISVPIWVKLKKSGNNIVLSTCATENGSYTDVKTFTDALVGVSTLYIHALFASNASGDKIQVKYIV